MGIAALVFLALFVASSVTFVVRVITAIVKVVRSAYQNTVLKVNWKRYWKWQLAFVIVAVVSFVAFVIFGGFAVVGFVIGLF